MGIAALGVLGFVVGGFVNLLVDRVPRKRSLRPLAGGCRRCAPAPAGRPHRGPDEGPDEDGVLGADQPPEVEAGHGPVVGAVLWPLRRRCQVCGAGASPRYAAVQVLTAVTFAAVGLRLGADWAVPAYLVLCVSLLAVSVIDLELNIIPNRIVYPTIFGSIPLLAVAAAAEGDLDRLGRALLGAAAAWAALLVIHLVSPAGMGFGDVRLSFVLGLFLGWLDLRLVLIGLFLGFLLGSVLGVLLVVVGQRGRKDHIPFGPFLAAGAALAVFFGDPLLEWWFGG